MNLSKGYIYLLRRKKMSPFLPLSEEGWKKMENPISLYIRLFTILPFFTIALWSRIYLSFSSTLILIMLATLWAIFSYRMFPEAKETESYASDSVKGLRILIEGNEQVQESFKIDSLLYFSILFFILYIYAMITLSFMATIASLSLYFVIKLWGIEKLNQFYHQHKNQ